MIGGLMNKWMNGLMNRGGVDFAGQQPVAIWKHLPRDPENPDANWSCNPKYVCAEHGEALRAAGERLRTLDPRNEQGLRCELDHGSKVACG